jgi:predicted enzyme related to lactoylglutathione lyase
LEQIIPFCYVVHKQPANETRAEPLARKNSPADPKGNLHMDWKLELIAVPVSDVDRAKAFYTERVGFNADHDHQVNEEMRFVQLTPSGSACSIAIGSGIMDSEPGSVKGLQLVVSDIEAAHAELAERGVEVSGVQDLPWGRCVFFNDPDGNGWAVQEVPARP